MSYASDIVNDALALLPSPRHWRQGFWTSAYAGGRRCLGAALLTAGGYDGRWVTHENCMNVLPRELLLRTAQIITEHFPERVQDKPAERLTTGGLQNRITAFNDYPGTRFADVRLVLEKLAADETL